MFLKAAFERAANLSYVKYRQALFDWQVGRVLTASELLGIPVEDINPALIGWCHALHGVPPLEDEAPKATDFPLDRRIAKMWSPQ